MTIPKIKPQNTSAGFIYILKPLLLIDGREIVKIGITTRTVAQRVRELSTGSVVAFEIAYSLHIENARQIERQLHARYRNQRLIGGGKEFFFASAKEIIFEIERMATEISRSRAEKARDAEITAFSKQIGSARIESFIAAPVKVLLLIAWPGLIWVFHKAIYYIFTVSSVPSTILFAFLICPPLLTLSFLHLQKLLYSRFVEPRFGSVIRAKHKELKIRYPLAYN